MPMKEVQQGEVDDIIEKDSTWEGYREIQLGLNKEGLEGEKQIYDLSLGNRNHIQRTVCKYSALRSTLC